MEGLWHVVIGDPLRHTAMSETEVSALLDRLVHNLCSPINATAVATDVGPRDGDRANDRIHDLVINFLSLLAAVVFAGVAIHELNYASAHPYAYGPAKVIPWGGGAGTVLAITVALVGFALSRRPEDVR